MRKILQPQSHTAGLPPGTVVHVSDKRTEPTLIEVIRYDGERLEETTVDAAAGCPVIQPGEGVTWVNVTGIADTETLTRLGECFQLHPLVVEDIANADQRVKAEEFADYLYLVLKVINWDEARQEVGGEQASIILGPNFVLSFQETPPDAFELVKERLRNEKSRMRRMGADFLAYALIDAIVDDYFAALEQVAERIEALEDRLVTDPRSETLQELHELKREMIFLRKAVWPLREVIGGLERRESPLITKATGPYLRDVYDHTIQVIDTIEAFRDMLSGMLDIYLSSLSNRMNAVMKVLTIIATIFIPLTFLAGVYGMNFHHFPEIAWPWGYPAFWAVCVLVTVVMLVWFRRKRWM